MALSQDIYEFDGTVVGMSSGFIGIRDLHCRVHGLGVSGTTAVWNGRPFHLYDESYSRKNVHVVAVHHDGFDDLVSAQTRSGPSAPKNCTSYSAVRQLEGVLTAYSLGSSLGSFTIKLDTGDDVTFSFSNSDARPRFFGNRRITGGLPSDVVLQKSRVIVRYHTAMDVNGRRAEVVAVDRARSR
jgi:hypothetical protein